MLPLETSNSEPRMAKSPDPPPAARWRSRRREAQAELLGQGLADLQAGRMAVNERARRQGAGRSAVDDHVPRGAGERAIVRSLCEMMSRCGENWSYPASRNQESRRQARAGRVGNSSSGRQLSLRRSSPRMGQAPVPRPATCRAVARSGRSAQAGVFGRVTAGVDRHWLPAGRHALRAWTRQNCGKRRRGCPAFGPARPGPRFRRGRR
jgi:hypothetical protein